MNRRGVRVFVAVLAAAMLWCGVAWAFPPKKPYDPRPLAAAAEKAIQGDKYSFVVMGDVKGGGGFLPLVKRAEALNPTFILLTGDMVANPIPKLYDTLEAQIGALASKTACFPCLGNHELGGAGTGVPPYAKFWGIDTRHYSFDFKNARFICMDVPGGRQASGAELAWAEKLMAEARKDGKLIFVWQHVPCYTVGGKTRQEVPNRPTGLTKLLAAHTVTADFAGHDHIYYRTQRDGVPYIIQGLGGAGIYGGNRRGEALPGDVYAVSAGKGEMTVHNASGDKNVPLVYMLTHITVDGKTVTGKTMTSSGDVIDEFVLAGPGAARAPAATAPSPAKKAPATEPVGAGAGVGE